MLHCDVEPPYIVSILLDSNIIQGQIDDDINFTYDANTEVYGSCTASLNNEMFVFGGHNEKRQVPFQ